MKQRPLFSIIIPAYNSLNLFRHALNSVLKQNGNIPFEIIITDDSSNNDISIFIKSLHNDNIRYIHNNPSKGAVENWNYGISLANGYYIILLHHDEAFESDKHLSYLIENFQEGYDAVISYVHVTIGGEEHKSPVPEALRRFIIKHPILLFALNVIGPTACVAIKKEYCSYFNTKLHWLVDVDWYYRILLRHKLCIQNKSKILSIHGHKDQITENINIQQTLDSDSNEIMKSYKGRFAIHILLSLNKLLMSRTLKNTIRKIIK